MDKQADRPVLVEFWDLCRPSSMRTLPYLKAWHTRYAAQGLRVISVHTSGYDAGRDDDVVRGAVTRLGIEHPVLSDPDGVLWADYGNRGWPARYLWNGKSRLDDYHYGEGAYGETERAIQALLGVEGEVVAPIRPEDDPEALIVTPSEDQDDAWSGPYEAGGVWGVFAGSGTITVNDTPLVIDWPGARLLLEHPQHTHATLKLDVGPGVECLGLHFTPGLAG